MSVTITAENGTGSTTPITILSPYSWARRSRSIVHNLIGGGIAISMVAPNPRSGSMELLYPSESAATDCAWLHNQAAVFSMTDTDSIYHSMRYAVDGGVSVAIDPETLTLWIVTIDFQEVT